MVLVPQELRGESSRSESQISKDAGALREYLGAGLGDGNKVQTGTKCYLKLLR